MQDPAPMIKGLPLCARCLALTGTLETSRRVPFCYSAVAGGFDGQGISFGACQWNLGQGTLQSLLRLVERETPETIDNTFGDLAHSVRAMLKWTKPLQLAWAETIQGSSHALDVVWRTAFGAFGATQECQRAQVVLAKTLYYEKAIALCEMMQVWSERAVALMFDIKAQNGSLDQRSIRAIRAGYDRLPEDPGEPEGEAARLLVIADVVARQAPPQYQGEVRNRKRTIARGEGMVRQIPFHVEVQFGIRLVGYASNGSHVVQRTPLEQRGDRA